MEPSLGWSTLPLGRKAALIVAGLVVSVISLGVHDRLLVEFGWPYPHHETVPAAAHFVDTAVRVGTLVLLCQLARARLNRLSTISAAVLIGTLLAMYNESVRVIIINMDLTKHIAYPILDRASYAIFWFTAGAGALIIARACRGRPFFAALAVLLFAVCGTWLLQPGLDAAFVALERVSSVSASPGSGPPFDLTAYFVIFITFIEPTLAVFVLLAFVWPALPGSKLTRSVVFAALMLLLRGRIISLLLFSHWVPQSRLWAILAETQFLLETLCLTLFAAWTWAVIGPGRDKAAPPSRLVSV